MMEFASWRNIAITLKIHFAAQSVKWPAYVSDLDGEGPF